MASSNLVRDALERATHVAGCAPKLISLLLAALIAVELTQGALALWGAGRESQPVASGAAAKPRLLVTDVQRIVDAHLFGIAVAGPGGADPADARPTAAHLVLDGTIATEDPEHGIAIISDDGPSKVYSVGDHIGGASLHSVYLDHVILERAGNFETLKLPRLLLAARSSSAQSHAAPAPRAAVYTDSLGRVVDKPPGNLQRIMRMVDTVDGKTGKMHGYRVYPVAGGAPMRLLGLYPGDVLTAVNGTPLDDLQDSQEILRTVDSSDQVTVTVERQGRTLTTTLDIAEATKETKEAAAGSPPPGAPEATTNASQ